MIRINSYSEFKNILLKLQEFDKEQGKSYCSDACKVYAGIAGRPNAVYDMSKSPRESSICILEQNRDMLEHRLFPFYEERELSFVTMDKVTFYGIDFFRSDKDAFILWLEGKK